MVYLRLAELRERLGPVYGPNVDWVISLLGNKPTSHVLREAEAGRLTMAHAWQNVQRIFRTPMPGEHPFPDLEDDWNVKDLPDWFKKPPGRIPRYQPKIRFGWVQEMRTMPKNDRKKLLIVHPLEKGVFPVGYIHYWNSENHGPLGRKDGLYVHQIQQTTGGLFVKQVLEKWPGIRRRMPTVTESSRVSGWKYSAMRELEDSARKLGKKWIFVETAARHALYATSESKLPKPVHHQLLNDYGRLLTRLGYELVELPDATSDGRFRLFWAKSLVDKK